MILFNTNKFYRYNVHNINNIFSINILKDIVLIIQTKYPLSEHKIVIVQI